MLIPVILIGGLLVMAGGAPKKKRRRPTPEPPPVREPTPEEAEAITYCEMEGGTASAVQTPDGQTYFVCTWPDGQMAEVVGYHRGEISPACPIDMVYDVETQKCISTGGQVCPPGSTWSEAEGACVAIGDAWPPPADDPNFQLCMGAILAAWSPYTLNNYNLAPAVADNLFVLMSQVVEEDWEGYNTPEALADFGMVHIAPECDWVAMQEYVESYRDAVGMLTGAPEDMQRIEEVYASAMQLAHEVLASTVGPDVGFDPTEPKEPDVGINPDYGGIFPKCPPNYFYDALHGVCCPDGFFWNVEDQMCRPLGYGGFAGRKARSDAIRHGYAGQVAHPSWTGRPGIDPVMYEPRSVDAIRHGYAGGCGGRRGHCGVRSR